MDERVLFIKGKQRKFLDLVSDKLNCVSIRGILQYGFDVSYSCLKNYYCERRLLPSEFFKNLCYIAKINPETLDVKYIKSNWGQIKGGKKSRKREIFELQKPKNLYSYNLL